MVVNWDNREGFKQINIEIPYLVVGDASGLTYGASIRLCDIGTKTQDEVIDNDWCAGEDYVESGEFKNARLLRRRVL